MKAADESEAQKKTEQRLKNKKTQRERLLYILNNVVTNSESVSYQSLDNDSFEDDLKCKQLRAFLNSLEMAAQALNVIKRNEYAHRVRSYPEIEKQVDEIPRAVNPGNIFNIKTFILSCKNPFMKTKTGTKVFVSKDY